jgi:PAS domain-containing protein
MTTQFAGRTGIACRLDAPAEVGNVLLELPAVANSLYRITQEALNNVAKHAKATLVEVGLDCTSDGLVLLRISDNGTGMRKRDRRNPESFGLLGMAERVHALGGQLRIEGHAEAGTMIEVLVPTFQSRAAADPVRVDFEPTGDSTRPGELDESAAMLPSLKDELGHPLQVVIDALAGNVAVLDSRGTIQLVNRAWCEFAERNGDPGQQASGPGVNYLEVCRRSATGDPTAEPVLQSLNDVLAGRRTAFTTEYPCDMPDGRNWFRMHAAAITGGITIVSHVNLTSRVDPDPATRADVESS